MLTCWSNTGAVLVLLLPQDMVEAFSLGEMEKAVVTLANDQRVEMAIAGRLVLTALGWTMNTDWLARLDASVGSARRPGR